MGQRSFGLTLEAFNKDDRYRIEARVGSGAMATVYKAYDLRLQRVVALKVLHEHLCANDELRQRFEQEAKLAARIDHPNVVRIYDFGVDLQGQLFIVSEFVEGRSLTLALRQYMNRSQPCLNPVLAALVALEIGRGMQAAHKHAVVHRDLKPDNVLVSTLGEVKLTDFGVARPFDSSMTQAGQFIGSLTYASPEQVLGGRVDARSDIFSFAVILFELLTGQLPFRSTNPTDLAIKISQANVPPLNQLRSSIPIDLDTVVRKCLRADSAERPQSAELIVNELLRFLTAHEVIPSQRAIADGFENPALFSSTIKRSPLLPDEATRPHVEEMSPQVQQPSPAAALPQQPSTVQAPEPVPAPANPLPLAQKANPAVVTQSKKERSLPIKNRRPNTNISQQKKATSGKGIWLAPFLIMAMTAFLLGLMIKERELLQEWVAQLRNSLNQRTQQTNAESSPPSAEPLQVAAQAPTPLPTFTTPEPRPSTPTAQPTAALQPTQAASMITPSSPRPVSTVLPKPTPPLQTNRSPNQQRPSTASTRQQTPSNPRRPSSGKSNSLPRTKPAPVKSSAEQSSPSSSSQLTLQTTPGEVTVYINGEFAGLSSRSGTSRTFEVEKGNVLIRIPTQVQDGRKYEGVERKIKIEAGKNVVLPAISLRTLANVTIRRSPDVQVHKINGKRIQSTGPSFAFEAPLGGTLEIEGRNSRGQSVKSKVEISADGQTIHFSSEAKKEQ